MPNTRSRRALQVKSKKQIILEYRAMHGLERASIQEIRAIDAEVRRRLGPEVRTSPSYIANILSEAGTHVEFAGRSGPFVDPPMEEPYATRLKGVLQFHDLESAEAAIRMLDALRREYQQASDRAGVELVRSLALKGKQRAESLGASARVRPEKRREKQEIASWFRVWLETPDLFFDWLGLRKQSEEFQHTFTEGSGQPAEDSKQ